jgi:hypothetical protein
MRSSKCPGLPASASLAIAVSAAHQRASRCACTNARHPSATITLVPFISARLSFGPSTSGASPCACSTGPAATTCPSDQHSRSPTSSAATYDSGVRSPLAPTDPSDGIAGSTRRVTNSHSRSSTASRTPDHPRASAATRTTTTAAASVGPSSAPVPHPWNRTRFSGIAVTCSDATAFTHESPNPVLTPYTTSPAASRSPRCRTLAAIRPANAASVSSASPAPHAARTTSSIVSPAAPMRTASVTASPKNHRS